MGAPLRLVKTRGATDHRRTLAMGDVDGRSKVEGSAADLGGRRPRHRAGGPRAGRRRGARAYGRDEESCGFLVGPASRRAAPRRHRPDGQPGQRAAPPRSRAVPAHRSHVLRHRLDEVRGRDPPRRGRRAAGEGALPLAPRRGRVLLADRRGGREDGAGRAAVGPRVPRHERARGSGRTIASSSSGIRARASFVESRLEVDEDA